MEDLSKLSDDERADLYKKFVSENEAKVKQYSMYRMYVVKVDWSQITFLRAC